MMTKEGRNINEHIKSVKLSKLQVSNKKKFKLIEGQLNNTSN